MGHSPPQPPRAPGADLIGRRIAEEWRSAAEPDHEAFEDAVDSPWPVQAVAAALAAVGADERAALAERMFEQACEYVVTLPTGRGTELDADLTLFAVPVTVRRDQAWLLAEPDVQAGLVEGVRASGIAPGGARVALCAAPLPAGRAAALGPIGARRLLEAFGRCMERMDIREAERRIGEIAGPPHGDAGEGDGGYLLLGARLLPHHLAEADGLTPGTAEAPSEALARAREEYARIASETIQAAGIDGQAGFPGSLVEALAALG